MGDPNDETPNEVLDSLVRDIVSLFTVDKSGEPHLEGEKNQGVYSTNIYLLFQLLAKDPKLNYKLKRACIKIHESSDFLWGHEVQSIFKKLKMDTANRASFVEFKKYWIEEINKISKGKPKQYSLIYPLNFKLEDTIEFSADAGKYRHPFNFGFKLVPFKTFNDQYLNVDAEIKKQNDAEKVEALKNVKPICNDDFSFCIIAVSANNWLCAQQKCERVFFVILGLLILAKYVLKQRLRLVPARLSKLTYSYSLLLEEGNFLASGFIKLTLPVEDLRKYLIEKGKISNKILHKIALPSESVDKENIKTFIKVLEMCRDIQNKELAERIAKNVAIYGEASSTEDLELSWFKYWIIIERCLAVANNTTFEHLKARVKHLPFWNDPYLEEKVDILFDKRNAYVHGMDVEISQFDRNQTKLIVDGLLDFLMLHANRWQLLEDLERYYKCIEISQFEACVNLVPELQKFYDQLSITNSR